MHGHRQQEKELYWHEAEADDGVDNDKMFASLTADILDLDSDDSSNAQDVFQRQCLMQHKVQEIVCNLHPTATVEIFGSRSYGWGISSSDIDMGISGLSEDEKGKDGLLRKISVALDEKDSHFSMVRAILKARVPLIKCIGPGACRVDISYLGRDANLKTKMFSLVSELDIRFLPLLRVVRLFR